MSTMTHAEVAEGVRAAIATYTHALDDGRVDDIVATFCPDGCFELDGKGTVEGHEALRETYAGWAPSVPQRHMVVNTAVDEWDDHEASAISDVVLMVKGDAGWAVHFVARYRDTLHHDGDGVWRFHRRTVS